jgi:hypothetical protein
MALLTKLDIATTEANADLVHALFVVGLSVIQLATGRTDGEARSRAAINVAPDLLASQSPQREREREREQTRRRGRKS